LLTANITATQLAFRQKWAGRPFPYSSAINYEIAEMAICILLHSRRGGGGGLGGGRGNSDKSIETSTAPALLDPTCGSGTFLAVAMQWGVPRVEGRDSNPACIDGTRRNLEFLFGTPAAVTTTEACRLVVRDSAKATVRDDDDNNDDNNSHHTTQKYNRMACNLPWGQNTKSFFEEDMHILSAARSDLEKGALCIIIWKVAHRDPDTLEADLEKIGYRSIDHALVPPKDFQFPQSTKVVVGGSMKQPTDHGRSSCVISVLETI
jgi:hypothetical protein